MQEMHNIVVGRDGADIAAFGELGTGLIGKHYVGDKKEAHLTNSVRIDFARPHIIGIFGKRGTGKSHTLGVIAEEMSLLEDSVRQNLSGVIIDAMGIFWSMKTPSELDAANFAKWDVKPKRFPVLVVIPQGQTGKYVENDIPYDATFSISPKELSPEDWALTFNISLDSEMGILLQKAIKRAKKKEEYSLKDIALLINSEKGAPQHLREALINRFAVASDWGIFKAGEAHAAQQNYLPMLPGNELYEPRKSKGEQFSLSSILDVMRPGKITVVDISMVEAWSVRALIAGIITKKILEARVAAKRKEEMEAISGNAEMSKIPMTWIMVDEAHQFIPSDSITPATAPFLQCIKIGREPGVSMIFATQQPNKLHEAAISQCDLVISHHLTSKMDIESLKNIMQTYLKYDLQEYFDSLPRLKGTAIILDDNSERIYSVRIRPRLSWHAGGSPAAIRGTK